jgi:hypothetical protein
MKNETVKFENNKELDYHEVSNLNKTDLVDVFRKCDELHKLCQSKEIPIYIGFVPSDRNDFYFSVSYDPMFDDEKFTKLSVIAGGTIKQLRERLGICYEFKKLDFNEIKR